MAYDHSPATKSLKAQLLKCFFWAFAFFNELLIRLINMSDELTTTKASYGDYNRGPPFKYISLRIF